MEATKTTNNVLVNSLMAGLANYRKGSFGTTISITTTPKMNKGGKGGIAVNPLLGRDVQKHTIYTNVKLGSDYNKVNGNKIERAGGEKSDWVAEPAKGMHRFNDFICQSDTDDNQFYLNILFFKNTRVEYSYSVDGVPATEEQVETIKSYLTSKGNSFGKQIAAGIPEDEVTEVRRPKLENVNYIVQGERQIYSRPQFEPALVG